MPTAIDSVQSKHSLLYRFFVFLYPSPLGQDLVPEPSHQVEEAEPGHGRQQSDSADAG